MAWPSTLTSFTDPIATDRLNSPSHSSIETAQNTGLEELQNFIGVNTGASASIVGTLLYDIKAPDSNGGGHVQTGAKGGTGQTSYTKGDVLVAINSSTLTKLSVGSDTQVIQANSSTASGLNWVNSTSNKVYVNGSVFTVISSVGGITESSFLSTTIPGSTLGTNNAIRSRVLIDEYFNRDGRSVLAAVHYGGQRVASIMFLGTGADTRLYGDLEHTMIANESTSNQYHMLKGTLLTKTAGTGAPGLVRFSPDGVVPSSVFVIAGLSTGTSSINSSANQTLGTTLTVYGDATFVTRKGAIVEKIV